jgi:long-chain fatty acid transport protein
MAMWRPLALLTVLTAPGAARASGFLLYEQSATAMAKGSAVVASTQDPSASWFNPAALAYESAYGGEVSTALVFSGTRFSPAAGGDETRSEGKPALVPSVFLQGAVTERVHVGLAVLAPFGLYVQWPEDWVGADQSQKTDLKVIAANPSVAVRLTDRLSVAAGFSAMRGLVHLVLAPINHVRADLEGRAWGWGANVALLYRPLPGRLHFGATYRSRTRLDFSGRADFADAPGLEELLADQGVKATITVPDLITGGVMWCPLPRLELNAQIDWTLWSSFKELFLDFQNSGGPDLRISRSSVKPLTGRLGGEWRWPDWGLAARAGASYDQSASRRDTLAPSAPDANRLSLGTGAGYARGRITVDVGYLYVHFLPAEAAGPSAHPEGTYRSHAHVLAVTVGVRPR